MVSQLVAEPIQKLPFFRLQKILSVNVNLLIYCAIGRKYLRTSEKDSGSHKTTLEQILETLNLLAVE